MHCTINIVYPLILYMNINNRCYTKAVNGTFIYSLDVVVNDVAIVNKDFRIFSGTEQRMDGKLRIAKIFLVFLKPYVYKNFFFFWGGGRFTR